MALRACPILYLSCLGETWSVSFGTSPGLFKVSFLLFAPLAPADPLRKWGGGKERDDRPLSKAVIEGGLFRHTPLHRYIDSFQEKTLPGHSQHKQQGWGQTKPCSAAEHLAVNTHFIRGHGA